MCISHRSYKVQVPFFPILSPLQHHYNGQDEDNSSDYTQRGIRVSFQSSGPSEPDMS